MFRAVIRGEIEKCVPQGVAFSVSVPEQAEHGDYSSNVALARPRQVGLGPIVGAINPRELAEQIKKKLKASPVIRKSIEKIEVAGPGFLNFYLKREALYAALEKRVAQKKPILAKATTGKAKKICLEFVSANPTGPLTMANGRGGFYGDVLGNILETAGHHVTREFYVNDVGNQIRLLGESILAAEGEVAKREEHYRGFYIEELKGKTPKQAVSYLLKKIKMSLRRAGIHFDTWFSEDKNLHKQGELQKTLQFLQKKNLAEKREGALWLGDAVLMKSDGTPTYFLGDLAYHYDKFFTRKFDIAINIWGADHHGYAARMKQGIEAFGVDPERLNIIIMQLVRLISGGKEVRMSKRKGNFVTLDDLLDMVGADAARWFFLERSPNAHMDFDLDLAKERSKKNPVYYVQYAHARACSILKKVEVSWKSGSLGDEGKKETHPLTPSLTKGGGRGRVIKLNMLAEPHELCLIKKILQLPEVVDDIAADYQVQRLPKYAYELAQAFTNFYEHCRVIDEENQELTKARIYFTQAAQKTLAHALSLMGIHAPKKM